jgi:TusA-related sulfurtransferase
VSDVEATLTIDTRGAVCPVPIIELARRIDEVAVGAVIAVLADDPAARADVPAWCRMRGHDYLGKLTSDDGSSTTTYLVRRTE